MIPPMNRVTVMTTLRNAVGNLENLSRRYVFFLERKGHIFNFFLGIFCIGLLAAVDFSNHNEYFLAFLYLVPIALTTWLSGKPYGLALSALGTAILAVEKLPENSLACAWNTLSTLSVFVTVTMLVAMFRKAWETERQLSPVDHGERVLSPRTFSELVRYDLLRLKRNIVPFSVGVIDLDDFNVFNIMYGRKKGNELLEAVAHCLVNHVRRTDLVTRITADDFIVYFPATDEVTVQVPLQRIRQKLTATIQMYDLSITFSMGVVTCRYPPDDLEEIIAYANDVLHEVKKSGKDGVRHTLFADA